MLRFNFTIIFAFVLYSLLWSQAVPNCRDINASLDANGMINLSLVDLVTNSAAIDTATVTITNNLNVVLYGPARVAIDSVIMIPGCKYIDQDIKVNIQNDFGACWSALTVKKILGPQVQGRLFEVYCYDSIVTAPLTAPLAIDPCGSTGSATYVADWLYPKDCIPGMQDTVKVIYREWESFSKDGIRSIGYDTIVVYLLPQITATSIYCVDKDSIFCSNLDSLVGPYITLPETPQGAVCMDLPLIQIADEDEDGILEFSSYTFDELCGLNTHIDYEIFEVDCSKQYKITLDIKQSCYAAGQTTCIVPTPAGMDPNIAEELAPGYWRCEFWLIDIDTLPPELHCKYPILFQGEFDIDHWYIDIEGDGYIDTTWAPYEISLTGNDDGNLDLNTNFCLSVTKDTVLAFAYEYRSMNSAAGYDPFGYILNDSFYQLTIGERDADDGDVYQNGHKIVELRAGDLFCFSQQSSDGTSGAATTTIKQLPIVPTSTHDCVAHTYVPPVQVIDDWSGVKNVKASIPGIGTYVMSYNSENYCYESHERAALPHRPEPYLIAYEAQDSCHNTIYDTCYILVKDAVKPTAVVDKGITVSLSEKKVWIDAEEFDEGSFDNCSVNLLLVRRQDWYESCIDLCDSMEYICVNEHHDTLWKPVLETDKLINEVEAHYSENLKWWKEDREPCTNIIYNSWIYDLIKRGTAHCKPHPYEYSDEDVRDLMQDCLPAVMDYFVPVSLHPDPYKEGEEVSEQEDFKVDSRLLSTYEQIGGGWSDAVAIDCEDACGSVVVEILVMDYWCNWSTAWTDVWVEDKVPATVVQDVQDIDITCKIYKTEQYILEGQQHPLSIASIIDLAKEKDAVALGALDSIFGGYKKVWKGPYGNYLTEDGKMVEDIPFVDSSCYCEIDTIVQTRVYDEHLGSYWKNDTIYDCGYDEVVDTFQHGLVLANCSQYVECDQELWAEIDHCGEGYIYRKFKIWQGCPAEWYANGSVPDSLKAYHLPDTIYRTQRIKVYNECGLEKQMFDVPKDQEIVTCGIQYDADGSGNVAGEVHPDFTGWLQYRFDDDCRLVGIGYEDQVFKIVGGDEACYKILRTWYYMDWCEGQPLTDNWYDDPTLDIDSCVQRIFLIDTLAPVCTIAGPVMDGDTIEVSDCLYDFTAEVEMMDSCGITTYLYELYEISDPENVNLIDFYQSPKLKNAETAFVVDIEDLEVGNYKLKVIVTDACGNDGECFYYFTTKAVKKPTAISITSITARLNPMDLDQDGLVDTALVSLWAEEYDRSSRVACADSLLEFRIELVDGIGDDTWEDDLDSIELGCPDVGTSVVRLWVISWPSGTADYNDVVAVIQSNVGCDEPLADKPTSVMDFTEELTNRPTQTKKNDGPGKFDGVDFPARVVGEGQGASGEFELMQNYPNPFDAETHIGFILPENMKAELYIFNINGQRIKSIKGEFVKGINTVSVSSDLFSVGGIYYYQLNTSGYQSTKRMVFIK